MKKIIVSVSTVILLVLSYGIAIGAPGTNVSNVNVVNTPNVNVTVPRTQLLYSATSISILPITTATLTSVDVSSCSSIRLTFSAWPITATNQPPIICALVDKLNPQAVVAGAQASPNIGTLSAYSASIEVQTPSSGCLDIVCMNEDTNFAQPVTVALYCR